ncbi:ABC transporter substrate-binding protein [Pseudonocardia sp.]|jgi:iron complex transport system substrate-binding protein|uniref:ABC transporter substrate-binding protein n=1 Tax=Pseudonocardia sp. TaxID=60912 RepID=UPI0031FDCA30
MRIASLLPAATEIVGALGLEQSLAAVTFECDDPPGIRERRPVVVDTALPPGLAPREIDAIVTERVARGLPLYDLDREVLAGVAPDLILTQDLCRVCALPAGTVGEALDAIGITADVLSIDPHTLDDVLGSIVAVGSRAGVPEVADRLVAGLRDRLAAVRDAVAGRRVPRVLVLEWTDPPFLAGHWVPEMVHRAGGAAVGAVEGGRSVGAGWDVLPEADLVLVAPCGFGLDSAVAQAEEVRRRLPGLPVVAIDSAAYVVRAGPRLVDGVEAIAWALHPDAVPEPPPGRVERIG